MDINQIIIIAIVVLSALIIVVVGYYVINKIIIKKSDGKETLIKPNTLHEEESLMNMMDEKRTIEYQASDKNTNTYINEEESVNIVETKVMEENKTINPFNVDLTKKVISDKEIERQNSENKFFK